MSREGRRGQRGGLTLRLGTEGPEWTAMGKPSRWPGPPASLAWAAVPFVSSTQGRLPLGPRSAGCGSRVPSKGKECFFPSGGNRQASHFGREFELPAQRGLSTILLTAGFSTLSRKTGGWTESRREPGPPRASLHRGCEWADLSEGLQTPHWAPFEARVLEGFN